MALMMGSDDAPVRPGIGKDRIRAIRSKMLERC
jgi:hypothetical protein